MLLDNVKKYYKFAIPLNILLIVFICYQLFFSRYHWEGDREKKFIIAQGQSLDEIISGLEKEDVISGPLFFKLAVKLTGKENQIIANTYVFTNGMNNSDLILLLTDKNLNQLIKITIPTGFRLKQIAKLANSKLSLSADKIMQQASNDSLIEILKLTGQIKNLEGFLFPDTYTVSPGINEKEFVCLLFDEFRKKVLDDDYILQETREDKFTLLETITLASIIEGETRLESEKSIIAGVYINRLKKGMRLEADPTVQYVIPDGPKSRLLFSDLKIQSPYNTYINKGLPPGPINNPGLSSINAALDPDEHNFIFFVATGEGGHQFSENYEQHKNAIKDYKAMLREKKKNKPDNK